MPYSSSPHSQALGDSLLLTPDNIRLPQQDQGYGLGSNMCPSCYQLPQPLPHTVLLLIQSIHLQDLCLVFTNNPSYLVGWHSRQSYRCPEHQR